MMHYWHLLFDWDVLESVRKLRSFFEGLAIVLFALLVLFDILAHRSEDKNRERARKLERIGLWFFGLAILAEIITHEYGKRNDDLSENEIRGLSAVSHQARADASAAVANAGDARSVSSQTLTIAQGVRKEAESFQREIESAKQQARAAELHIQEAVRESSKAAEEARNARREQEKIAAENIRLQQQINPRRLSESQKRVLVEILSKVLPFTVVFEMRSVNGTAEVFNFTDDLKDVFVRMKLLPAGERPTSEGGINMLPSNARGVVIGVKSKTESPAAAQIFGIV